MSCTAGEDATIYGINQTFTVAPAQSVTDSVFLRRLGLFLGQCFHSIPDSKGCLSKDLLSFFCCKAYIYCSLGQNEQFAAHKKLCHVQFWRKYGEICRISGQFECCFYRNTMLLLTPKYTYFLTYLRSAAFKKYS